MKLRLSKPHGPDSKAWQVLKGLEQFENAEGVNTMWGLGHGNYDLIRKSKNLHIYIRNAGIVGVSETVHKYH